jgi:hypothetical protein
MVRGHRGILKVGTICSSATRPLLVQHTHTQASDVLHIHVTIHKRTDTLSRLFDAPLCCRVFDELGRRAMMKLIN